MILSFHWFLAFWEAAALAIDPVQHLDKFQSTVAYSSNSGPTIIIFPFHQCFNFCDSLSWIFWW